MMQLLRSEEKVKLWLGLAEEYNREDNPEEAMKTASAAAGTLAVACADVEVAQAVVKASCAETIAALLQSESPPLVHRALVMMISLLTAGISSDAAAAAAEDDGSGAVDERQKQAAMHLVMGGVVQAIGVVLKLQIQSLADLAKEAAMLLSKATKNCPEPPQPPPTATTAPAADDAQVQRGEEASTEAAATAPAAAADTTAEADSSDGGFKSDRVEVLEEIPHHR